MGRQAGGVPHHGLGLSLTKIITGGQTGVDRGALDAALEAGFPCGGWCPGDRRAEDGAIPDHYPLTPLPSGGYRERTHRNVEDSDGTVILFDRSLTGGTLLTHDFFVEQKKPFVLLDGSLFTVEEAAEAICDFVRNHAIGVLNVAGPRLSGWRDGYAFAHAVIGKVIERVRRNGADRRPSRRRPES